MSAAAGMSVG
jgi:hypothetical protein